MNVGLLKNFCESNPEFEICQELIYLIGDNLRFVKDGKNKSLLFGSDEFLKNNDDGIGIYLHKNIAKEALKELTNFVDVFSYLQKKGLTYEDVDPKQFTIDFVIYVRKSGKMKKIFFEYNGSYWHKKGNTPVRDALKQYIFLKNGEMFFVLSEYYEIQKFINSNILPLL